MQTLWQDLRYGARTLAKRPGFTLIAIITLALGIGANTAIFSLVNAALFKPLPVADEGRVVVAREFRTDAGANEFGVSYLDFNDWRAQSRLFESMAIVTTNEATLTGQGEPARVTSGVVSGALFQTLGWSAHLGRTLQAEDDAFQSAATVGVASGSANASEGLRPVMLTWAAWRNRFGGDPRVVGRRIVLDDTTYQIVGVSQPGIFPVQKEPVEFWLPAGINGDPNRSGTINGSRGYRAYDGVVARLRPGVTLQQAQAELDLLMAAIKQNHPKVNQKLAVRVEPLRELMVGDARRLLWLLLGVVGAVLLIACVNVANLLLARATTRQREIAIRSALGASRAQIAQQMLAESLLLSLTGAAVGLLLSLWLVDGLVALLPASVPRLTGLTPDWRVLAFTIFAALFTGALCGLIPALTMTQAKAKLFDTIKEGGRGLAGSGLRGHLRNGLVVGEIALAMVLLVGAGLLVKSFLLLNRVDPGFHIDNTLTAQFTLSGDRYATKNQSPERINQFLDSLTERVRQLPGVREVSYAQCVPLTETDNNTNFKIAERPGAASEETVAQLRFIGADYFRALDIPVKSGRAFTARDNPQSPNVALINETFARRYFNGEDPIGKHLKLGWGGDDPKEIVGVVGDVRHRSLSDAARPEMYVPQAQFANAGITLLVRSVGIAPESLIAGLKREVAALDPALPLTNVQSLSAWRNQALAVPRFNALLLGGFALLALVLTLVGLYGVLSYNVTQRTPEIGIRLALGAQAGDVLRLVTGEGMRLVLLGAALGVVGALLLTRLMTGLLYGVTATDPLTFIVITGLLATVALLACWLPARRATKVDPMIALRHE